MAYKTVYVFHPCRGESQNEVSEHVQNILCKFLHENRDEAFWYDCFRVWHDRFEKSREKDFSAYLVEDGFLDVSRDYFETVLSDDDFLLSLNQCDVAGFFVRKTPDGEPESVWQLLNENGRIDAFFTDANELAKPLRTRSGLNVQSCLAVHLDLENTVDPDAYVYRGRWIDDKWLAPVTGEWRGRSEGEERNVPWTQHFRAAVSRFSPNTRITAVDCHY